MCRRENNGAGSPPPDPERERRLQRCSEDGGVHSESTSWYLPVILKELLLLIEPDIKSLPKCLIYISHGSEVDTKTASINR